MSDPTPIASPLEREHAARRGAQAGRAERARLGEVDRRIAETNACPECGPAGAGGGDAGMHAGFVPVTRQTAEPRTGEPLGVVEWRPCFTCQPDRWAAWQEGRLRFA